MGGVEEQVEVTDIVFSPKGQPHGLRALPEEEFHVLGVNRIKGNKGVFNGRYMRGSGKKPADCREIFPKTAGFFRDVNSFV